MTWEHELYDDFTYFQDRPFFHSFPGDECMIGFVFAEEKDANVMWKKYNTRASIQSSESPLTPPPSPYSSNRRSSEVDAKSSKSKPTSTPKKDKSNGKKKKIDISTISAPTNFQHVGHLGYTDDGGFQSTGLGPEYSNVLGDLSKYGITEKDIEKNKDFVETFLKTAEAKGLHTANATMGVPGMGEARASPPRVVPPPAPVRMAAPPPESPTKVRSSFRCMKYPY